MSARRFYYRTGRVEIRDVVEINDYPPDFWVTRETHTATIEMFGVSMAPPVTRSIKHTFRRYDYNYGVDFIGPHRDSDYHED